MARGLALRRGPGDLRDPHGLTPLTVLAQECAGLPHDPDHVGQVARERVYGHGVERVLRACPVDVREVVPREVRQARHENGGPAVDALDRRVGGLEQRGVAGHPLVASLHVPVVVEVRLVPDLPGPDRHLGQRGVLDPEAALRPVAPHQGGEIRGVVGRARRRRARLAGVLRGPRGRVDHHGEDVDPARRGQCHHVVRGREARRLPRRGLGCRPVEHGAHRLDTSARHPAELGLVELPGHVGRGAVPHDPVEAARHLALGRLRGHCAHERQRHGEQRCQSPPHRLLLTTQAIERCGARFAMTSVRTRPSRVLRRQAGADNLIRHA
jgi:hypothetical protein